MKVFGLDKLTKFSLKHGNARGAVDSWLAMTERSNWRTPHDIKACCPSADFLAKNKVIFNIKGNHYRLIVKIAYNDGSVLIEWIGSHAQYDRLILE